ncbi:LCP family protein [Streptomyces sp. ODS05-4]|uniref:LCP family protein n=1 Tax=Streptomyces sp. ODS05-4 TaxID=2944939 RepID=UPI0027E4365D|nr:LCP family protein [Streptomyces sp. ODS05-4]
MNDQHDPYGAYDPYAQHDPEGRPRIVGYDAYGQPVYQQPQQPQQPQQFQQHPPQQQSQQHYPQQQAEAGDWQQAGGYADPQQGYADPGQQGYGQGYGQQYGAPYEQSHGGSYQEQYPDPYAGQYGQQPAQGYEAGHGQQQPYAGSWAPAAPAADRPSVPEPRTAPEPLPEGVARPSGPDGTAERPLPGPRRADRETAGQTPDGDYRTEQFSFVEEPDEDSEDVIDWLKFTESRSERREEARRRGRTRFIALAAVLAVALVGGVGWLWAAGKLPWSGGDGAAGAATAAGGPQKRDVIVLHLHTTGSDDTATALLVDNATTKQGTTVLLPNALSVRDEDGNATTLAKSVEEDGGTGTREAVGSLLGTKVTGTWRLDTPYLEKLVEITGGIEVSTDTEVPAGGGKNGAPRVPRGENRTLDGRMAVAYATYRAEGEPETRRLQRFGQVVHGVLRKLSDDPEAATLTVRNLAQVLDPSLPEKDLGASLARLAAHARAGDHRTALLPVGPDGSLGEEAARSVVKDVLGGSVSAPEQGAAPKIAVRNASGDPDAAEEARIVLVNGGFTAVDGGSAGDTAASEVRYADPAGKAVAEEVAKTLNLPASAVAQGDGAGGAAVTVVLGSDYGTG